jgi:hypothetical protein
MKFSVSSAIVLLSNYLQRNRAVARNWTAGRLRRTRGRTCASSAAGTRTDLHERPLPTARRVLCLALHPNT